ncbi:ATP-binding sensor histidine kinase [Nostoc sp.]|uniref:ATP-binding sensor histidine kinase n=1 Tax=Nostoc sp. TaxID=1180 RepID=UPI002FFA530B
MVSIPGYRISEELYNGSRTLVYRGYRESDSLPIVIKLLKNPYPSFSELLSFRNQYTIAKNLNSPLIVQTYSLEPYQNGYVLVMEDFGGISLKDWRVRGRRQSLQEFLEIAIALCNALDILYRERIIHKDIKPANILINPETKQVKLIDFSIASLLPRETQTLINPNVLEGTLAYISPEQTGRMNRGIDYRTDFYSLGVTFYELLTGELPFNSNDPMELVHCHIAKMPMKLGNREEIPQVISDIVMKLMAKNAEDRYQSALGLKFDLENCLHQLQVSGKIINLEIAQKDVCDRFIIPDKLYGRETEVETLLQAFEKVSLGATEMMLVAGFSGIGKTAVVNEVHKPIVRQRGYFIKGKYDQFQRNIPFSAFVQAFRDLIGQLLTESDGKIQQWRNKILDAVGENGQVIIEVIPELSKIIGEQAPAIELSGTSAQNRFNLLFQQFTQVFTSFEHPLVIFLDDLQWADSASLKLMQLLMADTGHLLIIGAYRDNEVHTGHPLMLALGDIAESQAKINTITLAPLSQITVNQLVADTLKCPEDLAWNLSVLIYQKTQGNPFFATQFLKALHQENLIQFDIELGCWQFDIAQVTTQAVTDDVVAFMSFQLRKLPLPTQKVLQLAACIGNYFDLATLAIVSEKSEVDTATDLWKALQEGLILPISDVYKFYQDETANSYLSIANRNQQLAISNEQLASYKFLHDRVQQAAYFLIAEEQKQAVHLQIGQLLLAHQSFVASENKIFDIVNHLALGIDADPSAVPAIQLAELALLAGIKAKLSVAYQAAINYFTIGLKRLSQATWQTHYRLMVDLHREKAECSYLVGEFETSESLLDYTLKYVKDPLDAAQIYGILMTQRMTQGTNMLSSVEAGIKGLAVLGMTLPIDGDELQALVEAERRQVQETVAQMSAQALLDLPAMTEPVQQSCMKLLAILYSASYLAGNQLLNLLTTLRMVNISLKYGRAESSSFAYCCYGMMLALEGDYRDAYQFGRIALDLDRTFNNTQFIAKNNNHFAHIINPFSRPLAENVPLYQQSIELCMELGDLVFGVWAIVFLIWSHLLKGSPLPLVQEEIQKYLGCVQQVNDQNMLCVFQLQQQFVQELMNDTIESEVLTATGYLEHPFFQLWQQSHFDVAISWYGFLVLQRAYFRGDYAQVLAISPTLQDKLPANMGFFPIIAYHIYYPLSLAAAYAKADIATQGVYYQQIQEHQQLLEKWAKTCPDNFLHKYQLISAELARLSGDRILAADLYDKAIALAKANGYIQEEALANELAAKFYLDWGRERIAGDYIIEAYYGYARWGAKAKLADLEKRYPQLLAHILQQTRSPLSASETIFALGSVTSSSSLTANSSSISDSLDLAAILKASQSLSGEIELEKLLSSLLEIVIKNAGANKCVFMMLRDEHLLIKGSIIEGSESVVLQRLPVEESQDIPLKLIYKVLHDRQTAVLIDASADQALANDPYIIRQQPKSILCSPILHQGKLMGILYLENNLATGAFTSERIELLNLLCAQAAISLENARLYEKSQQALAELQISESRFQKLANNLPGMIFRAQVVAPGVAASIPYVSSGCATIYEVSQEDFMHGVVNLRQMEHPDDRHRISQAIIHAIETYTPFREEFRIITPLGHQKWVQAACQAERQADDSIVWDGVILDISDRKHIEAEQNRLLAILESTPDLIGTSDPNGKILYLNRAWRELLDIDNVAVKETKISQYHPDWASEIVGNQGMPEAIRSGIWVGETAVFDREGGEIPVSQVVIAHKSSDGELEYFSTILRDISDVYDELRLRKLAELALQQALTDLQNAQLQMVQSEKMSALGNLVAGVAHEMNNPLGFIAASLKQAKPTVTDIFEHLKIYQESFPNKSDAILDHAEEIDLEYTLEDLPKMLDSMSMACDRLKNISTSLRTFSRADQDYKVPFNIHQGIDSTILILKHRLKANEQRPAIEVVTNYGDLPQVECFPGQLNQVFMNLLANAIDALDESNHGRIFEEIKANPNCITITTSIETNLVKIAIADNGKGMSEQVKSKVFDHLFTTKAVGKGTGLGLAIARQIVEETHGGKLSFNSVLGEGTEFIIEITV